MDESVNKVKWLILHAYIIYADFLHSSQRAQSLNVNALFCSSGDAYNNVLMSNLSVLLHLKKIPIHPAEYTEF